VANHHARGPEIAITCTPAVRAVLDALAPPRHRARLLSAAIVHIDEDIRRAADVLRDAHERASHATGLYLLPLARALLALSHQRGEADADTWTGRLQALDSEDQPPGVFDPRIEPVITPEVAWALTTLARWWHLSPLPLLLLEEQSKGEEAA
jgi:hypothetical protein